MEQGWKKKGNVYRGKYITRCNECAGEIIDRAGAFDIFIFHPPKELRRHPSWHCFDKIGQYPTKYKIHVKRHPKDVSSAIFYVQRMIEESYRIRR